MFRLGLRAKSPGAGSSDIFERPNLMSERASNLKLQESVRPMREARANRQEW